MNVPINSRSSGSHLEIGLSGHSVYVISLYDCMHCWLFSTKPVSALTKISPIIIILGGVRLTDLINFRVH